MWFYLGGLAIAVFLLVFFIIDMVYSYRIWNNNTISSGEAVFLIVINTIGLLLVLGMIFMFTYQMFASKRTGGAPVNPLTGDGRENEMYAKFMAKMKKGKEYKEKKEHHHHDKGDRNCPTQGSCYMPPCGN